MVFDIGLSGSCNYIAAEENGAGHPREHVGTDTDEVRKMALS